MKARLLALLCMFFVTSMAVAQNTTGTFQVTGVLIDSLTQEGEPYATIRIAKWDKPDKPVKMLVSDMQGKFKENVSGRGKFVMTITSVGRNPIVRDFEVTSGKKVVDLGILYVTDASNELETVEVVAQKPLVKADIDKIEYSVKDDPDAETNSVLEMLRKVPLVTVGVMVEGAVAGLVGRRKTPVSLVTAVMTGRIVGSALIKAVGLWLQYKTPLPVLLARIPPILLEGALISILLVYLLCNNRAVTKEIRGLTEK